ncbi:MAG: LptF/LptG family permease [Alphaproteobacteria bacterium]
MRIIQNYMARQLIATAFMATIAMMGVLWLTQSLRFLDMTVAAGAPFRFFIWLSLLAVPSTMPVVLPVAGMLAVVLVYGRLMQDSELIAMRGIGLSNRRLLRPTLILALVMLFISFCFTAFISPAANRQVKSIEKTLAGDSSKLLLRQGVFNTIGSRLTVYIDKRDDEGKFYNPLIHVQPKEGDGFTISAAWGELILSPEGQSLMVHDGVRSTINPVSHQADWLTFSVYQIDIDLLNRGEKVKSPDPSERSLLHLWKLFWKNDVPDPIGPFMPSSKGKSRPTVQGEVHQRIAMPFMAAIACFIPLVIMVTTPFSRHMSGWRLFWPSLVTLLFQATLMGILNLAGKYSAGQILPYMLLSGALLWCTTIMFYRK